MWHQFKEFAAKYLPVKDSGKWLLAMSGGPDSMVLAHLLLKAEIPFEAAHANFQLRGEDSENDERLVRHWCDAHGIKLHVNRFALKSAGKKSVQEEARNLRYSWFRDICASENLSCIATAHHASDNVETLFINLLRGAGVRGWSGIPVNENQIVRPLLFATRSEIIEYAALEHIPYRTDLSNYSDDYLRNRIRNSIIPEFSGIRPGFERRISENQLYLRRHAELLDLLINEYNKSVVKHDNGQTIIRYKKISPEGFEAEILFHWLGEFGFNFSQCISILQAEDSGKKFFSETHRLVTNRSELVINKIESERPIDEVLIDQNQRTITYPWHMTIAQRDVRDVPVVSGRQLAAMDIDQLKFPLKLRKWQEGDKFQPLGMRGSKLVSDFMIDVKLSLPEKENQWVLLSGDKIVWLVGQRIADWVKVTANTNSVLLLNITP